MKFKTFIVFLKQQMGHFVLVLAENLTYGEVDLHGYAL